MGIKQILIDDRDGSELADDTPATHLTFNGSSWTLYLSEKNFNELHEVILDWTQNVKADTGKYSVSVSKVKKPSSIDTHGADTKQVREWAIKNKVKNDNGKVVGDRGRISQSVYDAYTKANQF